MTQPWARRVFLKTTGLLAASLRAKTVSRPHGRSTVVVVRDPKAVSGSTIDSKTVQAMVDAGIQRLTGIPSAGEAWKSLFPGITGSQAVGIKVNCINSALSSHPHVAFAIANGLKAMPVSGGFFPENNIIVWDRTSGELRNAGYAINKTGSGVRCFGTSETGVGYSGLYAVDGGRPQQLSRILTERIQFLINLSVLKNHGSAGVTLSMKNHYGTCHDPDGLHAGDCSPAVASLNALEPIRQKQVVAVCDALFGIVSGGPGGPPQVVPKSLIFSRDPVALDTVGAQTLQANGCRTAGITGNAKHISRASQAPYSLGTCDMASMDLVTIDSPATGVQDGDGPMRVPDAFALMQNFPNPFNSQTRIPFFLPRQAAVRLDVFDARGKRIRRLVQGLLDRGVHTTHWDGLDDGGRSIPTGMYIAVLSAGGVRRTVTLQLIR